MRNLRWVEVHVPRSEFHIHRLPIFLNAHGNIPLELIKELFCLVVVIIFPGVGACDNHHDVITTFDVQILIPHRWLEQITVVLNPLGEVEWLGYWHEVKLRKLRSV